MPRRQFAAIDLFADRVKENTEPEAIVLIPARVRWQDFRLRSQRALFVDYKAHPFLPDELFEWRRRVQRSRRFHESPSGQRPSLCRGFEVDYYAIRSEFTGDNEEIVARTDEHALVRCPRPER